MRGMLCQGEQSLGRSIGQYGSTEEAAHLGRRRTSGQSVQESKLRLGWLARSEEVSRRPILNTCGRSYLAYSGRTSQIARTPTGQLENYCQVRAETENHTIGIVLCKRKNSALVEITLFKDANIHAREYQLYLPSKQELQQKLVEWMGVPEEQKTDSVANLHRQKCTFPRN